MADKRPRSQPASQHNEIPAAPTSFNHLIRRRSSASLAPLMRVDVTRLSDDLTLGALANAALQGAIATEFHCGSRTVMRSTRSVHLFYHPIADEVIALPRFSERARLSDGPPALRAGGAAQSGHPNRHRHGAH